MRAHLGSTGHDARAVAAARSLASLAPGPFKEMGLGAMTLDAFPLLGDIHVVRRAVLHEHNIPAAQLPTRLCLPSSSALLSLSRRQLLARDPAGYLRATYSVRSSRG